jgi:hypothetical protein
MRKGNIMFFTNLGIVKCEEFEYTYDIFYDKMCELMRNNPNNYRVSYDNGKYEVIYNSQTYEVRFGKDGLYEKTDVVELLDKLVHVSEDISCIYEEEIKKIESDDEKRNTLFDRARKGIIDSNEEKRAKIELLNREYKEKGSVFKRIWKLFKFINVGKVSEDRPDKEILIPFGICMLLMVVFSAFGLELFAKISAIVATSFALDGMSVAFASAKGYGYRGLLFSILSIISLPINIGYNVVKKIVEAITHRKEVNNLKNSITDLSSDMKDINNTINGEKLNKLLNQVVEDNYSKVPSDLMVTYDKILELKDNIQLVKDKKTSKKLAMDLYDVIKYYIDGNKYLKNKDNMPTILYSQVMELSKRVDDILKQEKEQEELNKEYNNMMDVISHQKSIGAR